MRKNISIAMTTYNGEKFLVDQLNSIITQLVDGDELIISDDGSSDNTIKILNRYANEYNFIKFIHNTRRHGVVGNFENALLNCKNDIIFLADQDDIWANDKVKKIVEIYDKYSNVNLILHNANIYYSEKSEYATMDMFSKLGFTKKLYKTIWKNPFIGCCMSFKKDLLKYILPMPSDKDITIHDWWIALCAIKSGDVMYCSDKLIDYRIHGSNTLGFNKTSLIYKFMKRLRIIKTLYKYRRRFR